MSMTIQCKQWLGVASVICKAGLGMVLEFVAACPGSFHRCTESYFLFGTG